MRGKASTGNSVELPCCALRSNVEQQHYTVVPCVKKSSQNHCFQRRCSVMSSVVKPLPPSVMQCQAFLQNMNCMQEHMKQTGSQCFEHVSGHAFETVSGTPNFQESQDMLPRQCQGHLTFTCPRTCVQDSVWDT